MDRRDSGNGGIADGLQPLLDDDAFLTSLSRGEDPTNGQDELAKLLLELRADVNAQFPPAPVIDGAEEAGEGDATPGGAKVVSLGAERKKRRVSPLMAGFVGAAASAALVVGSGAAIYNAEPGSALWPISSAIYGDRTAVVELASTLEEMESASESGDEARARELLGQARSLLNNITERSAAPGTTVTGAPGTDSTVTVTQTAERTATASQGESSEPVTVTAPPESRAPVTVTETETRTQTETQVATVTVEVPVPQAPEPTVEQPSVTSMVPLEPATPQ